jgi:hypothetical protein
MVIGDVLRGKFVQDAVPDAQQAKLSKQKIDKPEIVDPAEKVNF